METSWADSSMPLDRLLLCYVPGLDVRRIEAAVMPNLAGLIERYPKARVTTLPATDHLPTILTGLPPQSHGFWGPCLKPANPDPGLVGRFLDTCPSPVTTTAQLAWHHLVSPLDGATLPPHRRRRFAWMRAKSVRSVLRRNPCARLNGKDTLYTRLTGEPVRFLYQEDFCRLGESLDAVASEVYRLEMLEVHCLDRVQHWCLHDEAKTAGFYRRFDDFLASLHARCRDQGIVLVLLSDHGMEPVRQYIDLVGALGSLHLDERSYDVFVEPSKATFWIKDEEVRSKVLAMLRGLIGGDVLGEEDLLRFGLDVVEGNFGELFFFARPGYSIFPYDFNHPLANIAYGLKDWQQRPRIWNPRHRGEHGHLPAHACEEGLFLLVEETNGVPPEINITGVATTILDLLGQPWGMKDRGRAH
jgi:hypothetical protein